MGQDGVDTVRVLTFVLICQVAACDLPGGTSPSVVSTPPVPAQAHGLMQDAAAPEGPDAEVERLLTVHIVPIGPMPQQTVDELATGLQDHAPVRPVIVQRHGFPASARSARAGAYQAHVLLEWLDSLAIPSGGKVMGITEADIVTRKGDRPIWGILGMASLDGRCSVVSTYRMRRKWENGGASDALVRDRLWKVAVHELGHTLGLDHCPKIGCLMEDGHGTVKTVDRDTALCDLCASRFAESLRESASP